MAVGAVDVQSHIPEINARTGVLVCDNARNIISSMKGSGKSEGVIWIEYYTNKGETVAQVHFIPNDVAQGIRPQQPANLAQQQ